MGCWHIVSLVSKTNNIQKTILMSITEYNAAPRRRQQLQRGFELSLRKGDVALYTKWRLGH